MALFNPVLAQEVNVAGNTTTTSTTDVVVTSTTITPGAGTYLVLFSTDLSHGTNSATITTSIYQNGAQVANSERFFQRTSAGDRKAHLCSGFATVADGQAIDIRWRTSTGTATMANRSLALLKVG